MNLYEFEERLRNVYERADREYEWDIQGVSVQEFINMLKYDVEQDTEEWIRILGGKNE